jgi:uncharacterized protein (TIGR02996 family)
MTPEDAFLEDIRENPEDDAVRLIYADWLEDRGGPSDSDRAEFIRVQIGAHSLREQDLAESNQRACDLLERHWDDWTAPLWRVLGRKAVSSTPALHFRRGFLHELALDAAELLAHHRALFRLGPIGKLRLMGAGGHGISLAACESLSALRELEFADYFRDPFTGPDMMALANSPHLGRLRVLRLARNNLGDAGLYALAGAKWLSGVVALDLTDNGLSHDGVLALARTRRTFRPFWLRLARNPIGASGRGQMAGSDLVAHILGLDNPVGRSGSLVLAGPDILADVVGLDLGHCNLDDHHIAFLASLPLESLRELDLEGNDFGDEAARTLVRAPWMSRLRRLGLRNNAMTHAGLGLIAPLFSRMRVEL